MWTHRPTPTNPLEIALASNLQPRLRMIRSSRATATSSYTRAASHQQARLAASAEGGRSQSAPGYIRLITVVMDSNRHFCSACTTTLACSSRLPTSTTTTRSQSPALATSNGFPTLAKRNAGSYAVVLLTSRLPWGQRQEPTAGEWLATAECLGWDKEHRARETSQPGQATRHRPAAAGGRLWGWGGCPSGGGWLGMTQRNPARGQQQAQLYLWRS